MRSVHLQKDKSIFDLSVLPAEEFAASLGLAGAPQIKLLDSGAKIKKIGPKVAPAAEAVATLEEEDISDEDAGGTRAVVGSSESEGEDLVSADEDDLRSEAGMKESEEEAAQAVSRGIR